jgi:hypothetical protein
LEQAPSLRLARFKKQSKRAAMSAPKKSVAGKRTPNKGANRRLVDLFRQSPFGIPPSPLQQIFQEAAKEAGWIPPSELERQSDQKRKAGERSGISRSGRKEVRLSLVWYALRQLSPKYQRNPYSNASLEALRKKYDYLIKKNADDPDPILSGILSALTPADRKALKKASDDTLLADLKTIKRRNRGII